MPTLKTPRTRAVFGGFCTPKTGVFQKDANPLLNGLEPLHNNVSPEFEKNSPQIRGFFAFFQKNIC